MIDKEHKFCIGKNDHSWEVGYDKGYQQGKADAIDECIRLAEESCYKDIDMLISHFKELKEQS